MAWVAEENFDSYSDNVDIAGKTGGSGWSAGWVNGATELIRSTTDQAQGGSVSAEVVSGTGNTFYTRLLTTEISSGTGITYVAMRMSVNNSGTNVFSIRSSAGGRISLNFLSNGNIISLAETLVTGFTVNIWYVFRITWNFTAGTYTVATSADGGAYGSESASISMANSGNFDRVALAGDSGSGFSFTDTISATDPLAVVVTHLQGGPTGGASFSGGVAHF